MCETERQAEMGLIEFDRFAEQDDCDKYNMLQQSACEIRALENKKQQLKEVIEEIRKYIESDPLVVVSEYDYYVNDLIQMEKSSIRMSFIGTLLQILDKAGDINEKKN